jgi:hypothetical protein
VTQERVAELERGSTFELDPVLETVLGQAVRLCRAPTRA